MRLLFSFLVFLLLFSLEIFAKEKEIKIGTQIGEKAPNFILENIKGQKVSLYKYLDKKIIVLNFFTTWCGNCRREIPGLNKIYKEYKKKGIEVIGIDSGEDKESVKFFAKKMKITYSVLVDENDKVASLFRVFGIPHTLVIDKKGIVKYNQVGSFFGNKNILDDLLKEGNNANR